MKFYNYTPNTTIIVPSNCNAKCEFCFWTKNDDCSREKYLKRIDSVIKMLPEECRQLSISGGEPTFDIELLVDVLQIIKKYKDNLKILKVVMTTNGFKLKDLIEKEELTIIDHINISRHSHIESENYAIFGTDSVPSDEELEGLVEGLEIKGIDCSMNYVYNDNSPTTCLNSIISFAKKIGFVRLHMRYDLSNGISRESKLQLAHNNLQVISTSSCPVCKNVTQRIKGFEVVWKYGELETFDKVGEGKIYEVIIQPDGLPTSDWAGNNDIIMELSQLTSKVEEKTRPKIYEPVTAYYSSGCGGRYGGSRSGC